MVLFLLVSFSPPPMKVFIDYCSLLIQASVLSILYQGYKEFSRLCCDGGGSVMIIPTGSKKQIVLVMTQQLSFHQSTNISLQNISLTVKFGHGWVVNHKKFKKKHFPEFILNQGIGETMIKLIISCSGYAEVTLYIYTLYTYKYWILAC